MLFLNILIAFLALLLFFLNKKLYDMESGIKAQYSDQTSFWPSLERRYHEKVVKEISCSKEFVIRNENDRYFSNTQTIYWMETADFESIKDDILSDSEYRIRLSKVKKEELLQKLDMMDDLLSFYQKKIGH